MKTPWTQCAQMCSNVVKLSSRACHVRRLVLHGTSGAIPAAFLYTDLYALGVAKSTDQALVVVFLATLTCSMVGMDSAIISFIFIIYMILYDPGIFHRRIHVSSDGAEKLQMSHMGMIHGWVGRFLSKRAIRTNGRPHMLKRTPFKWLGLTSSKGRHSRVCKCKHAERALFRHSRIWSDDRRPMGWLRCWNQLRMIRIIHITYHSRSEIWVQTMSHAERSASRSILKLRHGIFMFVLFPAA